MELTSIGLIIKNKVASYLLTAILWKDPAFCANIKHIKLQYEEAVNTTRLCLHSTDNMYPAEKQNPTGEAASTVNSMNIDTERGTHKSLEDVQDKKGAGDVNTAMVRQEVSREDTEKQTLTSSDVKTRKEYDMGKTKRWFMVILLCSAQFFDIFNSSATLTALPQVRPQLLFI